MQTELIQGNTTTIAFQSQNDDGTPIVLDSSMSIMILIYNSVEKILFEARYPQEIKRIDDTNYLVQLSHKVTRNFQGLLKMEFSVYDSNMVVIAKNKKEIFWNKNLSSKHIQK